MVKHTTPKGPGRRKGPASQMGQQSKSSEPTTQQCQQPAQMGPRGGHDNPALQDFGESMKISPKQGEAKDQPNLGRPDMPPPQQGQLAFESGQPGSVPLGTRGGKGHQGQRAKSKSQSSDKRKG